MTDRLTDGQTNAFIELLASAKNSHTLCASIMLGVNDWPCHCESPNCGSLGGNDDAHRACQHQGRPG